MAPTAVESRASLEEVWCWLNGVRDPEIPAISVVELGIVRDVHWDQDRETLVVRVTPTYSACPATEVIAEDIKRELVARGITRVHVQQQLSPPWTSEWISASGRLKLREFGIAPPEEPVKISGTILFHPKRPLVECPRCQSTNTVAISHFGSTLCKSQFVCRECREPFDYFKKI